MSLPTLRSAADLLSWAGQIIAELDRSLSILSRTHLKGDILALPVYRASQLPAPKKPGLVVAVDDDTAGVLMLISNADNTWRRADNLAVYP